MTASEALDHTLTFLASLYGIATFAAISLVVGVLLSLSTKK